MPLSPRHRRRRTNTDVSAWVGAKHPLPNAKYRHGSGVLRPYGTCMVMPLMMAIVSRCAVRHTYGYVFGNNGHRIPMHTVQPTYGCIFNLWYDHKYWRYLKHDCASETFSENGARMPVLVDGHNLIGQIPTLRLSDPDDEAQLVMLLRRYATLKRGRRVIVVFDHGVYGHPNNLNGYGVECVFAKSPRDADSEIIRRIRSVRRIADWIVISSDRAVAGEARAHGIKTISSQEFGRRLLALNAPSPKVSFDEKGGDRPLTPKEIDEWLRLFGIDPAAAEDEEEQQ